MKKVLILVIYLLLNGCIQDSQLPVTRIAYNREVLSFELDMIDYKVSIDKDSASYDYVGSDGAQFIIKKQNEEFFLKERGNNKQKKLALEEERNYEISGHYYNVKKLSYNKEKIDGEVNFYFCKEFGLILTKLPAWGSFTQFYNPDLIELQQLSMLIINESNFFTGQNELEDLHLDIDSLDIDM